MLFYLLEIDGKWDFLVLLVEIFEIDLESFQSYINIPKFKSSSI